jgi:hypothetical protein
MYKAARGGMERRTVLRDDAGVLWEGADGTRLLWSFKTQPRARGTATDLLTGESAGGNLCPWRVYRVQAVPESEGAPVTPLGGTTGGRE